jgi:hypothetical protein
MISIRMGIVYECNVFLIPKSIRGKDLAYKYEIIQAYTCT